MVVSYFNRRLGKFFMAGHLTLENGEIEMDQNNNDYI